jgi:hypothetical protein
MKESQRLSIVRRHLGRAQRLLDGFMEPAGQPANLRLQDFLRALKCELNHRELVQALNPRPKGRSKVEQADGKSSGDKQAA